MIFRPTFVALAIMARGAVALSGDPAWQMPGVHGNVPVFGNHVVAGGDAGAGGVAQQAAISYRRHFLLVSRNSKALSMFALTSATSPLVAGSM